MLKTLETIHALPLRALAKYVLIHTAVIVVVGIVDGYWFYATAWALPSVLFLWVARILAKRGSNNAWLKTYMGVGMIVTAYVVAVYIAAALGYIDGQDIGSQWLRPLSGFYIMYFIGASLGPYLWVMARDKLKRE